MDGLAARTAAELRRGRSLALTKTRSRRIGRGAAAAAASSSSSLAPSTSFSAHEAQRRRRRQQEGGRRGSGRSASPSSSSHTLSPAAAGSRTSSPQLDTKADEEARAAVRHATVRDDEALRFNAVALATARPLPRLVNLATVDTESRASVLGFYLSGEYDRGVRLACKVCLRYLRHWAGAAPVLPSARTGGAQPVGPSRRFSLSSVDTRVTQAPPSPSSVNANSLMWPQSRADTLGEPPTPRASFSQSIKQGGPDDAVAADVDGADVLTPAIIFDVDDTALSSFHAMAAASFTTVPQLMPHFFLASSAPALQPVLRLYRQARALGLVPVFVSERPPEARAATLEALSRAGFTGFRHLITRSSSSAAKGRVMPTASQFKFEVRQALVRRGFNIIAVVGDQEHDFAGGLAGDFQCKLPNLLYEFQ